MNLNPSHRRLVIHIWRELRPLKVAQLQGANSTPERLTSLQHHINLIVFRFVDKLIAELQITHGKINTQCEQFGRRIAAICRAADVDLSTSWEFLGLTRYPELFPLRSHPAKAVLWQLFLDSVSRIVCEAFCRAVASDFTSHPLQTIFEYEPRHCFLDHIILTKTKSSLLERILSKIVIINNNPNFKRLWQTLPGPPTGTSLCTEESPAPGRKNDHIQDVQAWEQRRSAQGLSGPAHIVPKNAETYRALYPYSPKNADELELQPNDIVFVVEKCDDGWYIGTLLRTGQFGTFPGNYVERH
ncbi:hypothetical protein QR680_003091 [Steinernema hermaphroditum]|uniref:SH3 domain-containing protein n=1 Tax=Steinernema hermaphroditum TaxID=289476 RepID=A0AA39LJN4_9BILA|nr:hypothetical protein QR680_003091 [Steinernema hermaphroditum]